MKTEAMATKKRPRGWQKGQSGNPKGRPRKELCITSQLEAVLNEQADDINIDGHRYCGKSKARVLAERMVDKAISVVNPQLVKTIVERIDGPLTPEQRAGAPNISFIKIVNIDGRGLSVQPDNISDDKIDRYIDNNISIPPPRRSLTEGQPVQQDNIDIGIDVSANIFSKKDVPELTEAKKVEEDIMERPLYVSPNPYKSKRKKRGRKCRRL